MHYRVIDQYLWVDGWTAGMAVEISHKTTDAAQVGEPVNGSQQMILRDMILQRELIAQRRLRFLLWSHHGQISRCCRQIESARALQINKSCSTQSTDIRRSLRLGKLVEWVETYHLNFMAEQPQKWRGYRANDGCWSNLCVV
jgi:hypothetical protein